MVYTNSLVAETTMNSNGAIDVVAADLGSTLNHTECVPGAVTFTYFFFEGFKAIIEDTSSSTFQPLANTHILYPNPANEQFIINSKIGNLTEGVATIMDINGKVYLRKKSTSGNPIDIQGLSAGHYLVIWTTGEKSEWGV